MSKFHNVRIVTSNGSTRVFLDDEEIRGCFHAELKWDVNEKPVLDLDMYADEVEVEIDNADVIKWKEVVLNDERS